MQLTHVSPNVLAGLIETIAAALITVTPTSPRLPTT